MVSSRLYLLLFVAAVKPSTATTAMDVVSVMPSLKFLARTSALFQDDLAKQDDNKDIVVKLGTSKKLSDYHLWHKFDLGNGRKLILLARNETPAQMAFNTLASMVTTASLAFMVAYLYKSKKEWPLPEAEQDPTSALAQWSSGPCECCQDPYSFLCACFCLAVRWGDTMDMIGLMKFWTAFASILMIQVCLDLPYIGTTMWFVLIGILAMYRQRLRAIFGMPGQGDIGTAFADGCLICWCTPCAVAQEARHVELAAKLGHEAVLAQRPIKDFLDPLQQPSATTAADDENPQPSATTAVDAEKLPEQPSATTAAAAEDGK